MNKKVLYALLLIAVTVIILILNTGGRVGVSLHFFDISAAKSIIFLFFIVIGVTIGLLLK